MMINDAAAVDARDLLGYRSLRTPRIHGRVINSSKVVFTISFPPALR